MHQYYCTHVHISPRALRLANAGWSGKKRVSRPLRTAIRYLACAIIRTATATAMGMQAHTISKGPAPYSYLCKSHISVPCPCTGSPSTVARSDTTLPSSKSLVAYSIGKIPVVTEPLGLRRRTTVPTRPTHTHPLPFFFLLPLPIIHHPSSIHSIRT